MIKAVLRVCSWLPLSVLHGLGTLVGNVLYALPSESRRITARNLQLCFPELTEKERARLTHASLVETARGAFELGAIWFAPTARVRAYVTNVQGSEVLERAVARGKGVIVLAPHLGSWELIGLHLTNYSPMTYLFKPPKLEGLGEPMTQFRSRNGATLVPTNRKGVGMLFKALERGEGVGILPDQEPSLDGGVFAPFFGTPALTMVLVSRLAARTGAGVVTAFARRLPASAGFEIVFGEVGEEIASTDLEAATTALNRAVEDCVRQAPEQYQWEYRRFKQQPNGAKNHLYR